MKECNCIYTKIQPRYHGQRMRLYECIQQINKKLKRLDYYIFLNKEDKAKVREEYFDMRAKLIKEYKIVINKQYKIYGMEYIEKFYEGIEK